MAEEWALGRGFRITQAKDVDTDGQQVGEVAYHTPTGAAGGVNGRRVGVKRDVNGFGGGVKSARYPDGQAVSGSINRNTGHGEPLADGEDADATLDKVAPPTGHVTYKHR